MKLKKEISLGICLILAGCASAMKPIQKNHSGSMSKVFSQYKNVLMKHDWEIQRSDDAGGFLQAIKPVVTLFTTTGILRATISCSEVSTVQCHVKIRHCNNTVPLSNCALISEKTAEDDDLKKFIDDIKNIK